MDKSAGAVGHGSGRPDCKAASCRGKHGCGGLRHALDAVLTLAVAPQELQKELQQVKSENAENVLLQTVGEPCWQHGHANSTNGCSAWAIDGCLSAHDSAIHTHTWQLYHQFCSSTCTCSGAVAIAVDPLCMF
jgi:hypothetical protein